MKVRFHPKFAQDVLLFGGQYGAISPRLKTRFRKAVDDAVARIKAEPTAAGHFLTTGSEVVKEVRRRNLVSFPYFVLYGLHSDLMVFGALIPSASDPLTWLDRFSKSA
jgi:hypothetical protein